MQLIEDDSDMVLAFIFLYQLKNGFADDIAF
jgi:hypothetical protein